ncbi:MAG: hypothetical protein AAF492_19720, partial [Verrucomicrobiota bacterium]
MVDPRTIAPEENAGWPGSAESDSVEPIIGRIVEPEPPPIVIEPVTEAPIMATVVEAGTVEQPIVGVLVDELPSEGGAPDSGHKPGFLKRVVGFIGWLIRGSFCIASLVI